MMSVFPNCEYIQHHKPSLAKKKNTANFHFASIKNIYVEIKVCTPINSRIMLKN